MARQRGSRWQADAIIEGKRQRKSFATEAQANAWSSRYSQERPRAPVMEETLTSLAKALEVDLWGRGDNAVRARKVIEEAVGILGDLEVRDFKAIHVQKLTGAYLKAGLSDATVNRKFAVLSKLCRRAVDTDLVDRMPKFQRRKEPKGRDRFLTSHEEERLFADIAKISAASHDLVVFLVDTGARLGEALSLQWYQVNFETTAITFDKTKADVTRTVGMPTRVKVLMEARRDLDSPFADVNRYTFRDHWNRAKVTAGFKDDPLIVPHILRHTCASRIVQDGHSLKLAQLQLGHKNASMTERYSHLAPDALLQVLATLEKRGKAGVVER